MESGGGEGAPDLGSGLFGAVLVEKHEGQVRVQRRRRIVAGSRSSASGRPSTRRWPCRRAVAKIDFLMGCSRPEAAEKAKNEP